MIDAIRQACAQRLDARLIAVLVVPSGAHAVWRWHDEYGVSSYSPETGRLSESLCNVATLSLALNILAERTQMPRTEVDKRLLTLLE